MSAREDETNRWIDGVQLRTELGGSEKDKILDLMEHPGFTLLLGLLLAERQGVYATIRNLNCGDPDSARRLGVVQGLLDGIDRPAKILLECAQVPTDAKGQVS